MSYDENSTYICRRNVDITSAIQLLENYHHINH